MTSFAQTFIFSLLLTATPVKAETIIFSVEDLLFEHPNYIAPSFSLTSPLEGRVEIGRDSVSERKTRKEVEKSLLNLLWEEWPDAESIRIWRGNVIVRTS